MVKELRVRKGLIQFGSSRALILPSEWIEELKIGDSDQLYLELKGKRITIEKVEE